LAPHPAAQQRTLPHIDRAGFAFAIVSGPIRRGDAQIGGLQAAFADSAENREERLAVFAARLAAFDLSPGVRIGFTGENRESGRTSDIL
jgi:hypothetical protein